VPEVSNKINTVEEGAIAVLEKVASQKTKKELWEDEKNKLLGSLKLCL